MEEQFLFILFDIEKVLCLFSSVLVMFVMVMLGSLLLAVSYLLWLTESDLFSPPSLVWLLLLDINLWYLSSTFLSSFSPIFSFLPTFPTYSEGKTTSPALNFFFNLLFFIICLSSRFIQLYPCDVHYFCIDWDMDHWLAIARDSEFTKVLRDGMTST